MWNFETISYYLNDPSKRKELWGTTANLDRRSLTGIPTISIPSKRICPPQIGLRRNKTFKMLDFPAPVLPTIPTWSNVMQPSSQFMCRSIRGVPSDKYQLTDVPPETVKETSDNAGGKDGMYLSVTFRNSISPWDGQIGSNEWPRPLSSSWGMSMY